MSSAGLTNDFCIILPSTSLQDSRHTSNKNLSQFMSEAGYSSTGPDAEINDNLAYTIEDHGSLLHEKEISSPYLHDCDDSYPLKTYAKPDYDETALWEENKNLKKDLKKLKQKEKKLSQNEKVILGQLEHCEDERYTLEGKLQALRDECTAKAKTLDDALKQVRLANLELASMTSKWKISQQEVCKYVSKMETEKQREEIDTNKRAEQLSCLQELRLQKIEFRNSVKSHAEAILDLHKTVISAFFSSKDSQIPEIDIHDSVLLIEELVGRDGNNRADNNGETLTKTHGASDHEWDLDLPTGNVLNAGAREKIWNMRWSPLVNISKKTRSYAYPLCAGAVLMNLGGLPDPDLWANFPE
ncbi:hypothetical protein KEM48_013054 [Puccinia striiformis f. sp. tritici PST-130]|uniref:Uncharacterized protein n=1 Tax=Puccinia striiformis f. sp. tritici PST-78 TaxID=1165861 RepID=A0A0L0VVE8_9BASI|nr:hypothetical protein KEM48_013054 [Puccinia striiformis f. sp. tritici PST-130]KNF03177.1 hypothetical protein PSTG_03764 [Puccinia striiformis f. sp. tritici PST-78]